MPEWVWSYLLSAIGLYSCYLTGKKLNAGWVLAMALQPLWIAYAVTTEQYGFIPAALTYGTIYYINWKKWRADS